MLVPTPYIVEEKAEGSNLLWIQERANTVAAAKAIISTGSIIPEKAFQFSEETIQILRQKENGIYQAPPYKYLSDAKEEDFA